MTSCVWPSSYTENNICDFKIKSCMCYFFSTSGTAHLKATYLPPQFRLIKWGDLGGWVIGGWSDLGREIEKGFLQMPPNAPLLEAAPLGEVPHVMMSDAAFPLEPYLVKPYPGQDLTYQRRIFNYQLSRARRVGENRFGILHFRYRTSIRRCGQIGGGSIHSPQGLSCCRCIRDFGWCNAAGG